MLHIGRRLRMTAVTVAMVLLASMAMGPAGADAVPPDAALLVGATEAGPGDTIVVRATDCFGTGGVFYRFADVRLVVPGPEPVVLAMDEKYGDQTISLTLPDWYEPGPGQIEARCVEVRPGAPTSEVFTYPPVDVTLAPGDGPARQTMVLGRVAVAEGHVIPIDASGCDPGDGEAAVFANLVPGHDLTAASLRLGEGIAGVGAEPDGSGDVHLDLAALDLTADLPPGPYLVVATCVRGGRETLYRPVPVSVTGANAAVDTHAVRYDASHHILVSSGEGCPAGAVVTVELVRNPWEDDPSVERSTGHSFTDGHWVALWDPPIGPAVDQVELRADCGNPTTDGFRYRSRQIDPADIRSAMAEAAGPSTDASRSASTAPAATPVPGRAMFTG